MPGQRVLSTDPTAGQPVGAPPRVLSLDPTAGRPVSTAITTARPPARSVAGELGAGVRAFAEQLNPVTALQGAATATAHPIQTVKAIGRAQGQLGIEAGEAFRAGDYLRAGRKALHWLLPVVGPALDVQAERLVKGEVGAGIGGTLGIAAGMVAPKIVPPAVTRVHRAVTRWDQSKATAHGARTVQAFQQAAPPSKATPYRLEDVQRAAPYLEGHSPSPITTLEQARDAADTAIGTVESNVAAAVARRGSARIGAYVEPRVRSALASNPRSGFATQGLEAVYARYPQLRPSRVETGRMQRQLTLAEADRIRRGLNADMSAILKRNHYDRATAFETDPEFAVESVVADQLRDRVYTGLAVRGEPGLRALRQTEGSIIKVRNALERQIFAGSRRVGGTAPGGGAGAARRTVALGLRATPLPAIVTDPMARIIAPQNLTRDQLIARAFLRPGRSLAPMTSRGARLLRGVSQAGPGVPLLQPMPAHVAHDIELPADPQNAAFRQWYAGMAKQHGLNPDPDSPKQRYDYRAAFKAGAKPDESGHWPSDFKQAGHPNEIVGGFNTRTGERVPGTRQASEAELVRLGWDAATAKRLSRAQRP